MWNKFIPAGKKPYNHNWSVKKFLQEITNGSCPGHRNSVSVRIEIYNLRIVNFLNWPIVITKCQIQESFDVCGPCNQHKHSKNSWKYYHRKGQQTFRKLYIKEFENTTSLKFIWSRLS